MFPCTPAQYWDVLPGCPLQTPVPACCDCVGDERDFAKETGLDPSAATQERRWDIPRPRPAAPCPALILPPELNGAVTVSQRAGVTADKAADYPEITAARMRAGVCRFLVLYPTSHEQVGGVSGQQMFEGPVGSTEGRVAEHQASEGPKQHLK
ncbi:hypothetical protein SKAU_G00409410 [Synaphobranchus kaupii]|uniref:Uncharacterized protein n=1 Tax=Synaphobranchus kaupii TaxID=118154 RepID=A0A9Q1EAQ7_SYNKA|nr:hypothetical protein SKAU_G00409410 [Synaphobranchus kaupii]